MRRWTVKNKNRASSIQFCILIAGSPRFDTLRYESDKLRAILENWRRRAPGGSVSIGNPLVGEPGSDASTADREQIPPLQRRRRVPAETCALPAQGAGTERACDCGTA